MLGWLVDNTILLTFLFGTIAVGGFGFAWTTGKAKYALVGGAAVFLIAALWLLGWFVVSDSQQILRNLDAMRRGVETENYDEVFRHVSKDFKSGGDNRDDIARKIKGKAHGQKFDIYIWDQQVERKGDAANAYFNFRVKLDDNVLAMNSAKGEFVREGGEWKLKDFEVYVYGTREKDPILGSR